MAAKTILAIGILLALSVVFSRCASLERDVYELTMSGGSLTAEQAEALEGRVEREPGDIAARTELLGYYFLRTYEEPSARKATQEHVLWLIENAPKSEVLGISDGELDSTLDPEAYLEGKNLWLEQIEENPEDLSILYNSAQFFSHSDEKLAEESLLKAKSLDPTNPEWPGELGFLYSLSSTCIPTEEPRKSAMKALEQYELAYELTADSDKRSYLLQGLAETALEAGEMEKAARFAKDMLNCDVQDWNTGNNIHTGNIVLGYIALQAGEIDRAGVYLIAAGATPGSPQLNSFGPDMELAESLLEAGEKDSVLEYFNLCSQFWEDDGCLEIWEEVVKKGVMPDFDTCRMLGPDFPPEAEEPLPPER